ncbi:MAG: 30S ribosomal protein S17 [Planctomycetes bacterium]|nr:30S ribosomal protein S17 [Planctomycetota bacterium]
MAEEKKGPAAGTEKAPRTVVGVVISDKMTKTITVRSEHTIKHPKFGKFLRRYTKYKAHDEKAQAKVGDQVELVASRPISKTKHWTLLRVLLRPGAPAGAAAETVAAK